MTPRTRRIHAGLAVAAVLAVLPACASAPVNSPSMQPTNTLPNPFERMENWARMPEGRTWGSTSAVAIDRDGQSVWVGERCGANTCRDSSLDPILKFDAAGNLVTSFGAGMIVWPHGIHVDYEGNVWITDAQSSIPPGSPGGTQPTGDGMSYGHQVHKFSTTGQHLLTLGVRGGAREPRYFWQPNDVLVAPNGDIFVAEGHSNNPELASARILKFDRAGNFIMEWGQMGNGPTDLMQPHALAMDSRGRLFVGDRSNDRIQIYDQNGNLLDTWYQFSRPSGLFIDSNDVLYVADSESGSLQNTLERPWLRGIRIGDARTGRVQYLIPDPNPDCRGTCTAEGVAVDRNGVIYGAEVGPRGELMRYVRR
jgi:streptogramin lyase